MRLLRSDWTVTRVDEAGAMGSLPAIVPGCVHTDLLAAGLIPDPFLDDNEIGLRWIGRAAWRYETTFAHDATDDHVDLVCEGLDTVATITLNGTEVGRTANMHRSYRFPVRHLLRPGANHLAVHFDSAYDYADRVRADVGDLPNANGAEPHNFIRKMACNFGWDWGPTLVTAGIWRPIGLHSWSRARLAAVRPLVSADAVEVHADIDGSGPLVLAASVAGVRAEVTDASTVRLSVPDADRWWPRGHGEQPLYDLVVTLSTPDGQELDRWTRRIGFRSVRVDTTPDAHGTPFTVVVNDKPISVRGANWIPDDTFPSRVDAARYRDRLEQAADANINLLRVWGGGIYESADFYTAADELGLLVQQDFLFACAAYPEVDPIRAEVVAEARDNVVRLMPHPSLVLWTGNNENLWGFEEWGWKPLLDGRPWGADYYFNVLPPIVAELDPTRPYWPGSPYSGSPDLPANDPAHGTTHIWDVWNQEDYTRYRAYRPRFVAEFGFQAPATYATLRAAVSDEPLEPESPGLLHHQKAQDGQGKLARGLAAHLPEPRDFADWHYLTQVNQARAVSFGIEHFRSLYPLCTGTIVWQLNDCWPVTSWAAIDSAGRYKPLWHALRRVYADRLLTIQPRGDGLAVVVINDHDGPEETTVEVARLDLAGQPLATATLPVEVGARAAATVALPASVAVAGDPRGELIVARAGSLKALWFFAEDRDIPYPAPDFDARATRAGSHVTVTVTARTILRDLTIFPDRLDPAATVDDALVTVLPGESVTFLVHGDFADLGPLTRHPVLRCVNDVRRESALR